MRAPLRAFVDEVRRRHGALRSASEFVALRRRPRRDDLLDSLTLAGQSVAEIAAGEVAVAEIDPDVLRAFQLQYPRQDFLETVRDKAGDPDALAGLVSGIKGKLFELKYVEWLNDGHLPAGHVAELATDPTQAGYDIIVRGADGQVAEVLQAKATASVEYIAHALERYPEIDVVATADTLDRLSDPALAARVAHSTIESADLESDVRTALAEAGPDFHLPLLTFAVIAFQSIRRVSSGQALEQVIGEAAERGLFAVVAKLASYGVVLVSGEPLLGIPGGVAVRLALARVSHREAVGTVCAAATERLRALRHTIVSNSPGHRLEG